MIQNYIEHANFEDTGFSYTLSLIAGKHKMVILYCLMEFQVVRFNELKRYLKTVSDKTLSRNLKELEQDQLILRQEYPRYRPRWNTASASGPIPDEDPRPAVRLGRRKPSLASGSRPSAGVTTRTTQRGPIRPYRSTADGAPFFFF